MTPLFPETRVSLVEALAGNAEERTRAVDRVVRVYRAPIIAVLRHRWSLSPEDAEDLAHDFLEHALSRDWLHRYDPAKGKFRAFLRSCLFAYASTAHERANRLKRGGGAEHRSMDAPIDERMLANDPKADALFEREWVRSVFAGALGALRAECEASGRGTTYAVFVAYDVEGNDAVEHPSYAALAERFAIPVTQVTNYLNWARRRFRAHTLDTLRALTANDAEFRAEARALLGVTLP